MPFDTRGICEFCEEPFKRKANNQRFCSLVCRESYSIDETTKEWVKREPKEIPKKPFEYWMEATYGLAGQKKKFLSKVAK